MESVIYLMRTTKVSHRKSSVKQVMADVKWTRRNNVFIISVLAEVQSAVDKLTRLSGKVDRNMLMWKEEQWVGLGR